MGDKAHTLLVTAQIEGGESNVADGELLGGCKVLASWQTSRNSSGSRARLTGVESGLEDSHTVVLRIHR